MSLETARAELQGLIAGIGDAYPNDPRARGNVSTKLTFAGRTLKDETLGGIGRALWMLLAAVGVVLLVACANVANLFLVRSETRQREVAIRRALGAARLGLGRYFFTESVLLAIAGGALGLVDRVGRAARCWCRSAAQLLPRLHEIRLEPIAIGYVAVLSVLAAIVFGAIPLWRGTVDRRVARKRPWQHGDAAAASRAPAAARARRSRWRLMLLVGSGLMVRSVQNLRAIDPGFNPDSTLTFSIGLPDGKYPTIDAAIAAHHAIIERLQALPGVTAAAGHHVPAVEHGLQRQHAARRRRRVSAGIVPPLALFRADDRRLLRDDGHADPARPPIDRGDVDRKEPVAVISQALANERLQGSGSIGRRVASNQPPSGNRPAATALADGGRRGHRSPDARAQRAHAMP